MQTNPKLAKAACPTCGATVNYRYSNCSNSWHVSRPKQEEAAEPRAKPYGQRQQHATGCPYRDGDEWCNCPLNPVPPPDDPCPVTPQELRRIADDAVSCCVHNGFKVCKDCMDNARELRELARWLERGSL